MLNKNVVLTTLKKKFSEDTIEFCQQQLEFKRFAKEMFLSASQEIEKNNYEEAKSFLISAAEGLNAIQCKDSQVKKLLRICYEYVAMIHLKEQKKKKKRDSYDELMMQHYELNNQNIVLLDFNRNIGQYQFNQFQKDLISQEVKYNVAKINEVLFKHHNVESENSIKVIANTYKYIFLMTFVIIFLMLAIIITQFGVSDENSLAKNLSLVFVSCTFIFPLLLIYFKNPQKNEDDYLDKKLSSKIKKINQDSSLSSQFSLKKNGQLEIICNNFNQKISY